MTKPNKLPDMPPPQPPTSLGDSPTLEQVIQEVKTLRLYTGNLMLGVRAMRDYMQENFHVVYNRLDGHDAALAEHDNLFSELAGD